MVIDSCSSIPEVTRFFNIIEALHIHFGNPGNHERLKQIQTALEIKNRTEIGSLSKTRWSCRYENCQNLIDNYASVKDALETEIDEAKDKNAIEAIGILASISKPEFVISLIILHSILSVINVLNKYFQTKNATLASAIESVAGTVKTLKDRREKFEDTWSEIKSFADLHDIDLETAALSRKRKQPRKMDDYINDTAFGVHSSIELPQIQDAKEYWKINIYNPVMDNVICNLTDRFKNIPFANSVEKFISLEMQDAEPFIMQYKNVFKIDTSALKAEASVIKNVIKLKEKEINLETLKQNINKDITPNLYKMIQIAISLPISSAGCERSFSAMRRVKTWLRTTMSQDRFSNLSLINIESSLVKTHVTADKILEVFSKKPRKLKLI